jgi:hypothetical protein
MSELLGKSPTQASPVVIVDEHLLKDGRVARIVGGEVWVSASVAHLLSDRVIDRRTSKHALLPIARGASGHAVSS